MTDVKKRLDEIAAEIKKNPRSYKKFEKEMNQLLGTELPERDEEAEERWENSYRSGRQTD